MKRIIYLFAVLFLFLLTFYGQTKDTSSTGGEISSIEICYGYKTLNQNFQNNFNTTNNFKFKNPLQTIGVIYSSLLNVSRGAVFHGTCYYNQIIPQAVLINGINKCNVTGFIFGASFGRDLFSKSEKFDLILSGGFNTGRLRFYGDELARQKNPFFAPKIAVQPKIRIKKIAISLTIEYDYDISKSTWQRTYFSNSNKIIIDKLHQTGLTTFIGVGYVIE